MRNSLKLFTWMGIPVYLHWTFGLIFVYILWLANRQGYNVAETLWLTGLFLALFACVLLHEYGHALAARRYGVKTRDIVLMPIGGMARLERIPERPSQEFVVAIAGPLVNVLIALVLSGLLALFMTSEQWHELQYMMQQMADEAVLEETGLGPSKWMQYTLTLIASNLVLVVFNLIPAFPMDGGRVLRALLAMRLGRSKATQIAALVGQVIALGFVLIGFYSENFMLAILGFFVIIAARSENAMVQTESAWAGFTAADAARSAYTPLYPGATIQEAVTLLKRTAERHFVLLDYASPPQVLGVLSEASILDAYRRRDVLANVRTYAERLALAPAELPLGQVADLLLYKEQSLVGVTDAAGNLIGVVDAEDLMRFRRLRPLWEGSAMLKSNREDVA